MPHDRSTADVRCAFALPKRRGGGCRRVRWRLPRGRRRGRRRIREEGGAAGDGALKPEEIKRGRKEDGSQEERAPTKSPGLRVMNAFSVLQ